MKNTQGVVETATYVDVPWTPAVHAASINLDAQATTSDTHRRFSVDVWRALLVAFCIPYLGFAWALIAIPTPGGAFGAQIGLCTTLTLHGVLEMLLLLIYPTYGCRALHILVACTALTLAVAVWVRIVLTLLMPSMIPSTGTVQLDDEEGSLVGSWSSEKLYAYSEGVSDDALV